MESNKGESRTLTYSMSFLEIKNFVTIFHSVFHILDFVTFSFLNFGCIDFEFFGQFYFYIFESNNILLIDFTHKVCSEVAKL